MTETISQIETNLDDLSPELLAELPAKCLIAGAVEAFLTPVQMKKNRPGILLTVLCAPEHVDLLSALIFRESTTFGVRVSEKTRIILERAFRTVATSFGDVEVKLGYLDGELIQRVPEFESCRLRSEETGTPLRRVYEAALVASADMF